ncbi:MAG: flagellar biosynthetic protein FliR [Candidatus Calescibacterium sp.]|nr:flagellar biosynthetic protein FliR [Candidatus Calescibacterium sp.]MDW8132492.1 flagellar biosynthetic protein FliR [Candidatus Calescibacterium sp.]
MEEQLGLKSLVFYLLIFARIAGMVLQAPLFASPHLNAPAKIGLIGSISLLLFFILPLPSVSLDMGWIVFNIIKEFFIGLIMGYFCIFILNAIQGGGAILDQQLGLSTGASFDPQLGAVNMNSRFMFYFAFTIFILSGGFYLILEAIKFSFTVIPISSNYSFNEKVIYSIINLTTKFFYIGLHVVGAVIVAVFIGQVGLGLIARVAPQSNVFMLSFPVNFMLGVFVLSLIVFSMYEVLVNHYFTVDVFAQNIADVLKNLISK